MNTPVRLTEDQVDEIAERAARKAVGQMAEMFYQEIGKTVVKKLLWLVGFVVVAAFLWAAGDPKTLASHLLK
jgi:hypothetical protein